jgi:hypothetical protein
MELAVITLIALACSTAMSTLAFMIGRCGRKLPIDGMLPRVAYSARFTPEADRPRPAPEPARPIWPPTDCSAAAEQQTTRNHRRHAPGLPSRRPSQGSNHPPSRPREGGWLPVSAGQTA